MMKKWAQTAFLMALLFLAPISQASELTKGLEGKGLPKISPPPVREEVLKNGIRCFLIEDKTLPIVTMRVITRTGGIYEPAEKIGLADLTGTLMRTGGAGELGPTAFDAAIDDLGAVITSDIGREMGSATLKVLSEDLEKGAGFLFDMIFAPRFDEARLKVARLMVEERLRRDNDDPDTLASWHFKQLVYGAQSPWARRPDKKTLSSVSTKDVRDFYLRYFKPGNMSIAAAGDFDTDKMLSLIRKLTAAAPTGEVTFPEVAPVELEFKPGTDFVVKPMTQSFIRIGHLGVKRHNPDKFALILLSDVLGAGNFKSRLMEDIRTKRGLAYSIWSDMTLGTDYGLFMVGVDTKSMQAGPVIELIREHIARIAGKGDITNEELDFARRSVLTHMVFEFDSAFKVADRAATFRYFGYPKNYWKLYEKKIAGSTAAGVGDAAKRYLHPEGLKVVVVGPSLTGQKQEARGSKQ